MDPFLKLRDGLGFGGVLRQSARLSNFGPERLDGFLVGVPFVAVTFNGDVESSNLIDELLGAGCSPSGRVVELLGGTGTQLAQLRYVARLW